jgi:hypothetical protein
VAALAALAHSPQPPEPQVEGAVSTDTALTWAPVPGAAAYIVRWRPTDAANWTNSLRVPAAETPSRRPRTPELSGVEPRVQNRAVLPHVRVDDFVFGVSSVSPDGYESPVASAVPGGAFRPYTHPPAK